MGALSRMGVFTPGIEVVNGMVMLIEGGGGLIGRRALNQIIMVPGVTISCTR